MHKNIKLVVFSILLMTQIPIYAHAQLADCTGITTSGYKVLLDDIFIAKTTTGNTDNTVVMDRLKNSLSASLKKLDVEITPSRVRVVRCEKRQPKDDTDFTPGIASRLNDYDVVLEVWGIIETGKASMYYALIPLVDSPANTSPDGVRRIEYKAQRGAAESWDVFEQANEIRPFILLNLGLKLLSTSQYDQAKAYFCKAEELLGGAPNSSGNSDILKYIQDLSVKTVDAAQKDQRYKGGLKVVPTGSALCKGRS